MTFESEPIISVISKKLHSKSLTPAPQTEDYEQAVASLQRVLTPEEARTFRAVWASEHAAWETLSGKTKSADTQRASEDILEAALRGEWEHIGGDLPWPTFRLRKGAAVLRALARDAEDVSEAHLAEDMSALAGRVEEAANASDAMGRKRREKAEYLLDFVERWRMDHNIVHPSEVSPLGFNSLESFVIQLFGCIDYGEGLPAGRSDAARPTNNEKAEKLLGMVRQWMNDRWVTADNDFHELTRMVPDALTRFAREVCALASGDLGAGEATTAVAPAGTDARQHVDGASDEQGARARELLAYVEQWCEEHEIGPHENISSRLRGMLATALLHFAVGVCARVVPQTVVGMDAAKGASVSATSEPIAPPLTPLRELAYGAVSPEETPTPPLPFWDGPLYISVNGRPLQVKSEDGKLDYKLLAAAMAEVAAMNLSREVRSTFNTLVMNAIAYEESRGVPLPRAAAPTDGNVLLAYNRCATTLHGEVSRVALLVEMRLANIGSSLKERRDYMEDMIRRGLLSLTDGGDPLLLGSHPATAPGSAS